MMYKTILFSAMLGLGLLAKAQSQDITLAQCLDAAMKNSPLSAQNQLYTGASELQRKNIDIAKLPQLNANGQATYQNEVVGLPFKVPGVNMPVIPKAQYKLSVDASQLIYDGGATQAQGNVEDFNRQINQLNNNAELYKIRERVNQLYFGILLSDLNAGVIDNTISDLSTRLQKVQSSVQQGIALPAAAELLQAEILKAGQRQLEIKSQKGALVNTLQVITGLALGGNTRLEEPAVAVDLSAYANLRPEFGVFGLTQQRLNATKQLSLAKERPKVFGFGTAGYGNPGYNFFKEGSDFFYTVGAKVSWNFWNWNQTRRERQIIDISNQLIENQKNAYDLANKAQVQQYLSDVAKADELIKSDDEIIKLLQSSTHSAASQLENGTLTAHEYITQQLAVEQAMLTRNLHKMQLLQSKALYKAATGGL